MIIINVLINGVSLLTLRNKKKHLVLQTSQKEKHHLLTISNKIPDRDALKTLPALYKKEKKVCLYYAFTWRGTGFLNWIYMFLLI